MSHGISARITRVLVFDAKEGRMWWASLLTVALWLGAARILAPWGPEWFLVASLGVTGALLNLVWQTGRAVMRWGYREPTAAPGVLAQQAILEEVDGTIVRRIILQEERR
jgi:hypothetical protein